MTLECLSDSCHHCTAKCRTVADKMSLLQAFSGVELPSREGDNMDRERGACSMRSMDPCSDLLDT